VFKSLTQLIKLNLTTDLVVIIFFLVLIMISFVLIYLSQSYFVKVSCCDYGICGWNFLCNFTCTRNVLLPIIKKSCYPWQT